MGILNDIQRGTSYQGNSTLGGGIDQLLELDYKPLQQLAQYTYLYNKSQYDQRQKDVDEKIKELSELAAYDLVNGVGKDAEEIKNAKLKLDEYARDYLSKIPANPKEKMDMKVDFDRKKAEVLNTINAGASRNIAYMVRKNAILKNEEGLTAAGVDAQLKDLDNELNSTSIFTPISSAPKFKAPSTDVGDSKIRQIEVLKKDGNNIYTDKKTIWSPKENMSDATLLETGLSLPILPKDATPLQKKEYEQRLLRGDTNTIWQQAGQAFNTGLNDPNYKKTITTTDINVPGEPSVTKLTDEIDYDKIKNSNPIISGILDLVNKHNLYIENIREQYNKGVFDNYDGTKSINIEEYQPIDLKQPLTGRQLIYLQKFAKSQPDKLEKDAKYTGAANAIKLKQMDEAGANYRARLPYIYAKMGTGTATKDEKSDYPVLKTQELVDTIGTDGKPKNFTELTPEQQSKIKEQVGNKITDFTTISIEGDKIKVTGVQKLKDNNGVSVSITIIPDDITKSYYDEVNKNDAGKEAPKRKYFKLDKAKQDGRTEKKAILKFPDGSIVDIESSGLTDVEIKAAIKSGAKKQ